MDLDESPHILLGELLRERATSVDLEALKNGINEVFEAVGGSSTEKETVLNYTLAQYEIDVYRYKNNFLGRWRLCNNFQNSNFFDKMRPFCPIFVQHRSFSMIVRNESFFWWLMKLVLGFSP